MPASPIDDDLPDESTVGEFGERLEAYAAGLPEREQRLLRLFIIGAMDPLERLRQLQPDGLLSEQEEAVLRAIDAETQGD